MGTQEKQVSARIPKPKKPETKVFGFRLEQSEGEMYDAKLKELGLTRSEFFRQAFRDLNVTFQAPSKDYERLLFIFNKSSNNLNQLAHRVHSAHLKSGLISETLYIKLLNELVLIRELLRAGAGNAN
jgi:hypothetical protein